MAAAPCLGGEPTGPAVISVSLEMPEAPAGPLSVKRACHCGCERGPAALVVAGSHVAPPPAVLRVSVPKPRHASEEPAPAPPVPPLRTIDRVPIPA